MIPTYRYSVSSPMPFDLNEDQSHQLFSTNHQVTSSSSSLSYPILFNPDQDQGGSYYWEPKHMQSDEEAEKIIPSSGSWDHPAAEKDENSSDLKLTVWKKEDGNENLQVEDGSMKWMSSKMRMMRRMMVPDQRGSEMGIKTKFNKFEEPKQALSSPLGTDNSSNNPSDHNITARVCADCHTTKTPLWRSGPRGPKSLCNACGIRQRKARRAMAAAAAAASASSNGTILMTAEASRVKGNKLHRKEKLKSECSPQLKKKRKLGAKPIARGRKNFGFEDLKISLSKNLTLQQVFPQDEKEAAILLMALSYGLLHGFPSDRYLDL